VRYDPVTLAISALKGFTPRFIEIHRVSPMTFRSVDVGVVLDMMIHDIDVLLMLMGNEPEQVQANAVSVFGEAEATRGCRFPPGLMACAAWPTSPPAGSRSRPSARCA